ncbi:MAG: hypothetical protein EPO08_21105 [Rhodospirillaceae bacterium]|nr:MAG: hypothetical protein EPO08_21105 [Rhodospirillaceae bacterium]
MTLLEKITKELKGSRVEPAELNGRPAWRITIPDPTMADNEGSFEAFVYKDAASVQIRHLACYQAAREAARDLRRTVVVAGVKTTAPELAYNSTPWKEARRAPAHFQELAGRTIEGDPRFDPPAP